MPSEKRIVVEVNGRCHELSAMSNLTLLDLLRMLGYVDVKCGCEKADCGACAVLLDGAAVDSCIVLAASADGRQVTTVTGLGTPEKPHPLQAAFIEHGSTQCGYCIPGMIIAAKALLDRHPEPTDAEMRFALSGNLCRCTGYTRIFSAIRDAAGTIKASGARP
jgi:aerobic carbon-monoxide dehydrogenase small subunit